MPNDPWGRPYVYTDLSQKGSKGKARKDGKLNPINSDFDLYSLGEDGRVGGAAEAAEEQGRRHPGARRRLPRAGGGLLGAWPRCKWTIVQSRVGRRVAALFALSGLVPLLILAGVTSWMVSEYLLRQEQDRLRVMAKESAMAAFERLLDVEDRLRVIGRAAGRHDRADLAARRRRAGADRPAGAGHDRVRRRRSRRRLNDADRARLAAGDSVLRLPAQGRGPIHLVVPASGVARYEGTAVIAALEPRTLWALDERASDGAVAP